ncbi:phage integrase N-terminal domain-containing protein [Legionella sp. 16cNR16C]|uniref:phage integrase N-terminal domain-containing protein n=1 Tax=Legionella sp. 16cNR16C TaxID=2905656 RepID=UPI001E415F61|nr:phage integrase N-terminal domain-containing protein [Legionella sp. 16cNR16C]MCE3045367.1 integrase [Legionella sp. 16cNR16C]
MRKQSLRQTANRYLHTDNRGSFKDKKHCAFVIHKMIDDLFLIGDVPHSWHVLKKHHIENLIEFWKKNKVTPATIMDYMTTVRRFLKSVNCLLSDIDNKSLGLCRQRNTRKTKKILPDIWTEITQPISRIIMGLQTQFGLTFSEAIQLIPSVHIREEMLWITREISFNSEDRTIPFRNKNQTLILAELYNYTQSDKCLLQLHDYDDIRSQWRMALSAFNLPTNKTYRYLYARQLKKELLPILGNYQTDWLIRDEMGIKSRNTLWVYLDE